MSESVYDDVIEGDVRVIKILATWFADPAHKAYIILGISKLRPNWSMTECETFLRDATHHEIFTNNFAWKASRSKRLIVCAALMILVLDDLASTINRAPRLPEDVSARLANTHRIHRWQLSAE